MSHQHSSGTWGPCTVKFIYQDHLWDCPKVVLKTTTGQSQWWSLISDTLGEENEEKNNSNLANKVFNWENVLILGGLNSGITLHILYTTCIYYFPCSGVWVSISFSLFLCIISDCSVHGSGLFDWTTVCPHVFKFDRLYLFFCRAFEICGLFCFW